MLIDLTQMPISDALRRLSHERRSGDLEVRVQEVVKTVFFDHGRVVFAASNQRNDRLGESLLALGRITDADLRRASAVVESDHKTRFGEALVKAGVLDENEVGRSVARQVNRIVLSLFRFEEGVATFEERRCTIPLEYMVSLSLPRILYEGIRTMRSADLVVAGLGDLDRRVTLAAALPFRLDVDTLDSDDLDILEMSRRRVSVRRLAWGDEGLDLPRLRAVYALWASGVLRDVGDAEAREAPPVQMETGTFLLSALPRRPLPSVPEAVLQEVAEELRRSESLDRSALLAAAGASRERLARALEEKMERYYALLDTVGGEDELRRDVEVILGRAAAALRAVRRAEPAERPAAAEAPATEAERLLREGELRMAVSDFASAVKAFTALVELDPDEARHHRLLAEAMALHPLSAPQAEREFVEALRLAPDDPELHFRFGLYYRDMKQRSRAVAELEATLHLDPRHAPAREALEALAPGGSAPFSPKGLLR